MCRIRAQFISRSKGPCMATICRPVSPARAQASRLSADGRTRAVIREGSPTACASFSSSLLPVVTRMPPGAAARKAPASSGESTKCTFSRLSAAPSPASVLRPRRSRASPVCRQAARISSETRAAWGWVASIAQAKRSRPIRSAIFSLSIRPVRISSRGWGSMTSAP